jgi:FtsH-binding integral membrane protein
VAPTLFAHFDAQLAGQIAGSVFRSEAWLSLVCALLMLVLLQAGQRRRSLQGLVLLMLVCTLIGHFGLQPLMAAAKEAGERSRFGMLHGVASIIYLIQSALGATLLVKL